MGGQDEEWLNKVWCTTQEPSSSPPPPHTLQSHLDLGVCAPSGQPRTCLRSHLQHATAHLIGSAGSAEQGWASLTSQRPGHHGSMFSPGSLHHYVQPPTRLSRLLTLTVDSLTWTLVHLCPRALSSPQAAGPGGAPGGCEGLRCVLHVQPRGRGAGQLQVGPCEGAFVGVVGGERWRRRGGAGGRQGWPTVTLQSAGGKSVLSEWSVHVTRAGEQKSRPQAHQH